MQKILTTKVGNLNRNDMEMLKNRLNHFFNEEINQLEHRQIPEMDLGETHYQFINYDKETQTWDIGPDSEFQWTPSCEFWEQKLNQFLQGKKNLDTVDEVGMRQQLIDCLYDFSIAYFKSDRQDRDIESRTCAYITCIGYSPYTLSEQEQQQLVDRLEDAQAEEIESGR